MPQSALQRLRLALTANALFSGACGSAAIIATAPIARSLGDWPEWLILGIGMGLTGFAAAIFFTVRYLRFGSVFLISLLDLLWVVTTTPLILFTDLLSRDGKVIVAAIGLVVFLFAGAQFFYLRRALLNATSRPGLYRHCMRISVTAQPDQIWRVIRDLGGIYRHSSSLASTEILGGDAIEPGIVRVCQNQQGAKWGEQLIEISDKERTLYLEFQTEEPGFPFPFSVMNGGWNVVPAPNGAIVDIWWNITPRVRYFGWILVALMTVALNRDMRRVLASMEAEALGRSAMTKPRLGSLSYC